MLKEQNRDLLYLFILNLAYGLSTQLINPLFPLFLEQAGATEVQNAAIISAGSLAATLVMLPSGLLVQSVGKKKLLMTGMALSTVFVFLMSFVNNWMMVAPLFIAFTVAGAIFVPARMAMIADSATTADRASLFGIMNLTWPISGIISPILSGFLIEYFSWRIVFLISATVTLLSLYPGSKIKTKEQPIKFKENPIKELLKPEYLPNLTVFLLFHFAMTTAISGVNMIIPLYLKENFGMAPSTIGLFFTVPSILTLFTQVSSGRLADKVGYQRMILMSVLLTPLLFFSWYLVDNWLLLLAFNSMAMLLWSVTWPAAMALISDFVKPNLRGAAFGVRMTGIRLGFTVGPIISSFFYSGFSLRTPFVAAAASAVFGIFFASRIIETPRVPSSPLEKASKDSSK